MKSCDYKVPAVSRYKINVKIQMHKLYILRYPHARSHIYKNRIDYRKARGKYCARVRIVYEIYFPSVTYGAQSMHHIFMINIAVSAERTGLRVKAADKFHLVSTIMRKNTERRLSTGYRYVIRVIKHVLQNVLYVSYQRIECQLEN